MTERDRALETGFQIGSAAAFSVASFATLLVTLATSEGLTAGGVVLSLTVLTLGLAWLAGFTAVLACRKLRILRKEFPAPSPT